MLRLVLGLLLVLEAVVLVAVVVVVAAAVQRLCTCSRVGVLEGILSASASRTLTEVLLLTSESFDSRPLPSALPPRPPLRMPCDASIPPLPPLPPPACMRALEQWEDALCGALADLDESTLCAVLTAATSVATSEISVERRSARAGDVV